MNVSPTISAVQGSRAPTIAANLAFVPVGIVTVLLGPMLPSLLTQWSLNYGRGGLLFTAQFLASTIAVSLSGFLISRYGFRFTLNAGLLTMALPLAALPFSSYAQGLACIALYGAGAGLAVPAANLLVAEVNPTRRSAALNTLNFSWSVGAVACPVLVTAAAKTNHTTFFLIGVSGFLLIVMLGIAAMPWHSVGLAGKSEEDRKNTSPINWRASALRVLCLLFFLYVGAENSFGGWIASYAKSLNTISPASAVMTPSFFYIALLIGRWLAPFVLRTVDEIKLARAGLLTACAGMAALLFSNSMLSVVFSVSIAGFGCAAVYPITIAMLGREFGPAASRIGSIMFTAANLGGACLPWLVGFSSDHFGGLKVGLAVPLIAGVCMYLLYALHWNTPKQGRFVRRIIESETTVARA
jgi:FHS family glucose/mannose:H+ symporter-like MFS transporter